VKGHHVLLCSELDNWLVRLPSGARETAHSSKSHRHTPIIHPRLTTNPGLLQRVDILRVPGGCQKGERREPMQHSAPGFEKPVAGEPSPTPCHLNPLYPGHATRSTQLTTGPSPWLPQFPPSISSFAGYQRVLLHLVKFCSWASVCYRIPALHTLFRIVNL
jgi:hypothetical protein